MDISAVVKTLPIYGKLYIYDTKYEARGRPIEFIKGMQRNNGLCTGDCDDNDNYGQGTDLSQTISGSLAAWNVVIKDRQVVYVCVHGLLLFLHFFLFSFLFIFFFYFYIFFLIPLCCC